MNIILFIIEIIFIALFFIISIFLLPIGYILRTFNKKISISYANVIIKIVFNVIKAISFTSVDVNIDKNIDFNRTYFYVSNHRGIFDIILLYPIIKNNCIIIAKDKMKKYLFVHQWMDLIGCYFLDRDNLRSGFKMVTYSIDMLKDGISVLIFPEGTRSKSEDYREMLEFKEGSFVIPKKANVEVVPIAIWDTYHIFEKNKFLNIGKKIKIYFGKPSYMDDEKKDGKYFYSIIKERLING